MNNFKTELNLNKYIFLWCTLEYITKSNMDFIISKLMNRSGIESPDDSINDGRISPEDFFHTNFINNDDEVKLIQLVKKSQIDFRIFVLVKRISHKFILFLTKLYVLEDH